MLGSHVPDLRSLELLLLVARTQSLSGAAAELGISQQAASSRMRTMEALVGTPLLSRSTRGSALTDTGELVVEWA
ncbi:MAG TPA: LysR family transcriptional regulator, partial [Nocardioides sp.]|nr:LysR family transcriptional regulator [Nocardioides sp.]